MEKFFTLNKTVKEKKTLDKSENMETIPKDKHIDTHNRSGNTYHKYPKG